MINPHILRPVSKRWGDARFAGGKVYLAVFAPSGHRARRIFKRASEAEAYADRLLTVCRRLYDQRIAAMILTQPEEAR